MMIISYSSNAGNLSWYWGGRRGDFKKICLFFTICYYSLSEGRISYLHSKEELIHLWDLCYKGEQPGEKGIILASVGRCEGVPVGRRLTLFRGLVFAAHDIKIEGGRDAGGSCGRLVILAGTEQRLSCNFANIYYQRGACNKGRSIWECVAVSKPHPCSSINSEHLNTSLRI